MGRRALWFFLIVILASLASASVRINEVELNPPGTDNQNEWIELYSSQEVNLDGWTIVNAKEKVFSLNGSFSGYKLIITPYNLLTNSDQKIRLFDSEKKLIDETNEISDSYNDERSWQLCDNKWKFEQSSEEEKNSCDLGEEVVEEKEIVEEKEKDNNVEKEVIVEGKVIEDNLNEQINELEVITLNVSKGIKTWKSKKQYIKEYALMGFTLFCLLVLVYLMRKDGQHKNDNDF